MKNAVRDDAGHYRLKLTNDAGYDTASFRVTVLDKPGPPRCIYGSDFAGEAFHLNWSAPLDDGGSEITNYIVEKCEKGTGNWQKVSSYCTTTHTRVRNLTLNKEYDFRVFAENQYGISEPCYTDESIKAKYPFDPPGPPGQPRDLASTNDSITVQWTRPRSDGGNAVQHYVVEKRKVGHSWTRASKAVVTDTSLHVPGLEEGAEYEFRVAAVNNAGPVMSQMPQGIL